MLHVLDLENAVGTSWDIKTVSKWTSRTQNFFLPNGRSFKWEYKKQKGFGDKECKGTALVMSLEGQRVAVLVRNKDMRTLGSKSSSAGNGGKLLLGNLVGAKEGVFEGIVVASCLLMLKKKVDRRRMVQAMMIIAVVT